MDPMLVLTGVLTGFLVGLTGVGGGSLTTPILLLVFGVAPVSAVGTDLWFAAITKVVASVKLRKANAVDWGITRRLWLGSITASLLCLLFLSRFKASQGVISSIQYMVGILVIITAVGLLFQSRLQTLGRNYRLSQVDRFKAAQTPLTVLAGVVLGALVTITSIGAGALGAVFLSYLYPLRLTPPRLVATDIVHAIPLTVLAGTGYLLIGEVDLRLLLNLLSGSIPAVLLGVSLSSRIPHLWLRTVLAVILAIVGFKVLMATR